MDFLLTHKGIASLFIILLIACAYVILKKPSHKGDWQAAQRQLPTITQDINGFQINNIRDFRYNAETNGLIGISQERFTTGSYAFNDLEKIWFGLSHFGDNGLAHAFLSFEFTNNRFLTLSIEARTEENQKYHPVLGLLNHYEKIYIFGTEADIIGLRTHARKEKVLLYPIDIERASQISLLKKYLTQAHRLETQPDFYNTLLDNCLTGLLRESGNFSNWDFVSDTRLILPGRSDELAQELGLLSQEVPLDSLRKKATIAPLTSNPNSENFSQQVRSGWKL